MPTDSTRRIATVVLAAVFLPLSVLGSTPAWAGDSIELSLRGLAQLQRLQEEKALRDKLQTLMESASPPAANAAIRHRSVELTQPVIIPSTVTSTATQRPSEPVVVPEKPVAGYTPLLVYGSPPALTVEAQTPGGEVHRFSEQATWGRWRVERISPDGVWLRHGKKTDRRFIALGEVLKETEQP